MAKDCFEARKSELRGEGADGRWFGVLELHVLPKLGCTPVTQLNQVMIKEVLSSLWREKPVTATKALERLGMVIKHAAAMGLDVDLQATTKARLLLGKPRFDVQHIPAMSWTDVPAFYRSLSEDSKTQLALRLLILTGVRSSPVRHVRLDQIDFNDGVWTIPANVMKGRVGSTNDFRVPLSSEALRVIETARPSVAGTGFLFARGDGVISDMTLSMHMKRRGLDARPHGFRTSLRVLSGQLPQPESQTRRRIPLKRPPSPRQRPPALGTTGASVG